MLTKAPYPFNPPSAPGGFDQQEDRFVSAFGPGQLDSASLTYELHFGLREKPFSLSPDPRFFFTGASYGATFEALLTGIRRREGIIALTGEVGTGKTILCRSVFQSLGQNAFAAFVPDPFLSREDLLKTLLVDFGAVSVDDIRNGRLRSTSRTDLSYLLHDFLSQLERRQAFAVVMIDEAQNLLTQLLKEIRVLSDLENRQNLLQVVLVGQPELQERLGTSAMRELSQRLSIRCELRPLAREDVKPYVSHRLTIAGSDGSLLFNDGAIRLVSEVSSGIPRLINLVCDRALFRAAHDRTTTVDAGHVRGAIDDLKWPPPASAPTLDQETRKVKPLSAKPQNQGAVTSDALEPQAKQEPESKPAAQKRPEARRKFEPQGKPQAPGALPVPDPSVTRATRARQHPSLDHQRLDFPAAGFDVDAVDDLSTPGLSLDDAEHLWQNHPVATEHRRASQQLDGDIPLRSRTRPMTGSSAEPTGAAARPRSASRRTAPSSEDWNDDSAETRVPDAIDLEEHAKPGRKRRSMLALVISLLAMTAVIVGFRYGIFGGLPQPRPGALTSPAEAVVPAVSPFSAQPLTDPPAAYELEPAVPQPSLPSEFSPAVADSPAAGQPGR